MISWPTFSITSAPLPVAPDSDTSFYLNPMTLNQGEELIVRKACLELLRL